MGKELSWEQILFYDVENDKVLKKISKRFNDFDILVESIKEHNKHYKKVRILNSPRPMKFIFGYECIESGCRWEIGILDFKKWIDNTEINDKLKANLMRSVLRTPEGILNLAIMLSNLR
jgi:hypothetical protein